VVVAAEEHRPGDGGGTEALAHVVEGRVEGAAGAVAADCAAAVGPDAVVWPTSPMPAKNKKPNSTTSAPMPKPEASTNSVPVAWAGIDGSSA